MTTSTLEPVDVDRLTVNWSECGNGVLWDNDANVQLGMNGGGDDAGCILIRLKIDGDFTGIYADLGSTDALTALDAVIRDLGRVRDSLRGVHSVTAARPGQCLEFGDGGRCRARAGHDASGHDFPAKAS